MIELTGDEIVMTLIMEHQVDPRRALVVEGEEDIQLLEIHLDDSVAYLMLAGSKSAILDAARQALEEPIGWALFIVDADFDRINQITGGYSGNVLATDRYDMLLDFVSENSRLISGVIISHSPPRTDSQIRERFKLTSHEVAQKIAAPVGALRYLVVSGEFDLSVRGWSFHGAIGEYENGRLHEFVAGQAQIRSKGKSKSADISHRIGELLSSGKIDHLDLINGHDLVAVIGELVRVQSGRKVSHSAINATLRAALSCEEFQNLSIIKGINKWANANGGAVFRCNFQTAA